MTEREEALVAALKGTLSLIRKAQDRLTDYLVPEGSDDTGELANDMLEMFDGPNQRLIEQAARNAITRTENAPA